VSKKNLLIVEDDETFRKVIRNVTELLGFQVREAENGLVAQTIFDLNVDAFDLIISDVQMPEMDGVEFLKHVRAVNKDTKFILMTGFSELIEAQRAYEIGANEFLAKPFRLENFKKVLQAVFAPKPKPE
jgi:CheY-like chemotaxis protein